MTSEIKNTKYKISKWINLVLSSYRRLWEMEGKSLSKAAELAKSGELLDVASKEINVVFNYIL